MNLSSIENFDKSQIFKQIVIIFAYVPVGIIAFGIIGNTICFFIFRFNKELSILSSFVILSFVAITDTLSLFVWNLNHFLVLVPGASQVEYVSLFLCKIMVFNQYWSLECSAWLLCLISIERYFTLLSVPGSFFSKIPFATKRFGIFSSVGVLVVFAFINLHIVVKNGYYDPPGLVNTTEFRIVNGSISNHTREILYQNPDFHCYYYSPTYPLNPWWDEVHLYLYSIVPLIVIVVFNGLTIYANMSKKTDLMMNSNSEVKTEFKKKHHICFISSNIRFSSNDSAI